MYICYMLLLEEIQCWSLLGLSALIGAATTLNKTVDTILSIF